jgi:Transposase DDE domain
MCARFVDDLRDLNVTPHIAQNTTGRTSAIDARTTRHPGYAISQQKRKRIEEPFGWAKTIGGLARPMLRGVARLRFKFTLIMAAYDLIRLPNLLGSRKDRRRLGCDLDLADYFACLIDDAHAGLFY